MKYDLGQESPSSGCCAVPSCDEGAKKTYYPSLYFSGDTKMDIPEEGTALITFRKIDSGENTRDPEDPKYRCEIEVQSIEVKSSKAADEPMGVNVGKVLKDAMRKKMGKGEYADGNRLA